ncbi:MAG: threonine synthase [Candidatus Hodarchaeales archaeon]|jgi:threonine synthase
MKVKLHNDMKGSCLEKLICTFCGRDYNPNQLVKLCYCGKVLFAHYDLEKAKETVTITDTWKRNYNIWRYHELMPIQDPIFRYTLGEGWTPLLKLNNIGKQQLGLKNLYLKDEGQNPTGTFKCRGLCAAVSKAVELGVQEFVIPTAGNAGVALAAYAARSLTRAHVYMPSDTPQFIQKVIVGLGGDLHLVEGLISEAGVQSKLNADQNGWFDVSTLKEPYRVEGKKTMGYEIAEQLNWFIPDVIVYPTGGGTGIIGMWKAFNELEELGLIGNERPRMVTVQSTGCAPIVKAFEEGKKNAEYWEDAKTKAPGLRVPSAIGDYLILQILRESRGTAVAADETKIFPAMRDLARSEGLMLSPEAAITVSGVYNLKNDGFVDKDETIILFGTGSGLIYPEMW